MSVVIVLTAIIFLCLVGIAIYDLFGLFSRKDKLFAFSCSYGLGVGAVTLQLYVYSRAAIGWSIGSIMFPWLIVFIFLVIKHRGKFSMPKLSIPDIDKKQAILLLGIIATVSYVLFEALLRPVTVWDGWAIWLLKSNVFFIDKGVLPSALSYVGADYPILISLLGTYFYVFLGHIDDTTVLLSSAAFYLFLGLSFFATMKKDFSNRYALFFTFLLLTTQNFIRHGGRLESGQADLPLAYFIFISTVYLVQYYKTQSKKKLFILCIFLGITNLIKVEGAFFTLVVALTLFFIILKRKTYTHMVFLLLWILPLADWYLYKKLNDFAPLTHRVIGFSFQRSLHITWGIVKELMNIKTWNMLWIGYFYILLVLFKKIEKTIHFLHLMVLSQMLIYLVIYFVILDYDPSSSIERLLLHIAPVAFLAVAYKTKQYISLPFSKGKK